MDLNGILQHRVKTVKKDLVWQFGNREDGVIEFAGLVDGGIIEVGYFYGTDKPKNILVISSQVGCAVGCFFCPMGSARGRDKFKRNLTAEEMFEQVVLMLQIAKEYSFDIENIEHKITFAKAGEPLLNPFIFSGIEMLGRLGFSLKLSTIFPRGTQERFEEIVKFIQTYHKPVQLQVSLVSTVEAIREGSARMKLASFKEISEAGKLWKYHDNFCRKINLSLMMAGEAPFDFDAAQRYFPPDTFRFRLRLYIPNENGESHDLRAVSCERYEEI
ncbi:hypothetical protein KJ885_03415, partial [Patescibacteria group bacterium]|nr:hypothetical protein [Patescibacteria group bacterium]